MTRSQEDSPRFGIAWALFISHYVSRKSRQNGFIQLPAAQRQSQALPCATLCVELSAKDVAWGEV